ncbi:MAG: ABC transporter ATP-binding protein [Candidatus Asgardarchaeia archaeon]
MLEVKNLYAGYGKFQVLFDINIKAPKKEITVVVGPNGAGKTTLLRSIVGLATIHSGDILYQGESITRIPPHKIAKTGIALVPQMGNVFAELTVYENLKMAGYTLEKKELENGAIDQILEIFPAIKPFVNRKAGTLSGGERRMLAIAMGLIRKPKLMLLDEVTMDLAPIIAKRVIEKVVELRDQFGITIILVEQMAKRALEIGDNAYLLVSGVIKFSGKADELLEHKELAKLYLGV